MFPDEMSGKELLLGLEDFVKHCVDVPKYSKDQKLAFMGLTKIDGKTMKCLLIVTPDTNEIITFYPFEEEQQEQQESMFYD